MADNKIQMPGVFGGLMRYDEEYKSRFMISPMAVIAFIILIIVGVILLKVFFPVNTSGSSGVVGNLPVQGGLSLIWVLGSKLGKYK
jgi:preprotein translocase subunit Sec61beta